ncbi:threonine dehydratase [Parasphingorhabdus sp.]|uniref:threonine dehydratase n=1 Tax=Parasphingorhabdus sp. TaxID=2709688 RepID=UPI003A94FFF7
MSSALYSLAELRSAAERVYQEMPPTPQYAWPLLGDRLGAEVWLKHENHTPTGAFKIRGGITFMDWLVREHPDVSGIVTATRGNHGQAQARAARAAGLQAVIVVPHRNSIEKNTAMRGFGAELIEYGEDYKEAADYAARLANERNLKLVAAFHPAIMLGVASYGLELFDAAGALDAVYVPIGNGSGICGTIAARNALGLSTKVIGVVSDRAPAAKLGLEMGKIDAAGKADTFADGVAVRAPDEEAFALYSQHVDHIVTVDDEAVADAIRIIWQDTHNLAEGAGAVALAGMISEKERISGKRVAAILSGGNMDQPMVATVLSGQTPLS